MDLYFLRKKPIFLLLKIGGVFNKSKRGSGYMTINISGEGISKIGINFIKVLRPRILTFKRFLDIYYQ
jgi:hypothetical protein